MIEREYEYRLKAGRMLTRSILAGAAAVWMTYLALTNDRGLILFVIPLEKDGATTAYAVVAFLAGLFCIFDGFHVARRASLRQRIAFAEDGLIVPRSVWSTEEERIPYESIRDLKEFNEPDSVVVIRHRKGEFTLRLDLLSDERAYAEIVQRLAHRVRLARPPEGGHLPGATQPKSA